ncbi:hypothetical protein ACZ90_17490 [Streptomyces albus subsp. albus]|nr:hypothetical protein ACZ90_17490 [Streptomyces albus subsp. albus]
MGLLRTCVEQQGQDLATPAPEPMAPTRSRRECGPWCVHAVYLKTATATMWPSAMIRTDNEPIGMVQRPS